MAQVGSPRDRRARSAVAGLLCFGIGLAGTQGIAGAEMHCRSRTGCDTRSGPGTEPQQHGSGYSRCRVCPLSEQYEASSIAQPLRNRDQLTVTIPAAIKTVRLLTQLRPPDFRSAALATPNPSQVLRCMRPRTGRRFRPSDLQSALRLRCHSYRKMSIVDLCLPRHHRCPGYSIIPAARSA